MDEKNTVFIGKKETLVYATTALILSSDYDDIYFAARGNNISKAIDAAFMTKDRYLTDWVVHEREVIIGNEVCISRGRDCPVSTIKVRMSKHAVEATPEN